MYVQQYLFFFIDYLPSIFLFWPFSRFAHRDAGVLRGVVELERNVPRLYQLEHVPQQGGVHLEAALVEPVRHDRQGILLSPTPQDNKKQGKNTPKKTRASKGETERNRERQETTNERGVRMHVLIILRTTNRRDGRKTANNQHHQQQPRDRHQQQHGTVIFRQR